jgi:hypothetical protein
MIVDNLPFTISRNVQVGTCATHCYTLDLRFG